ncbi:hypothetical protein OHB26_14395 [Nocardia sp. NBC_01503]|uniref:hypothetical protein n=1 Tax=Nocardia sp. NBC_01503 TaxID=2975997 RepID=UPI002E7B60D7|nr:hypothetical protein [Nocardia sp. NBC_01503]WTL35274.1 hypothetical protein OHB26_14395 [Nocardia sp. NBC_01503]
MGQHPGPVADVNVTVGPWVITAGQTEVARPQRMVAAEGVVNAWEPAVFGLYEDRDGDIWEKEERGWRLRLQGGVAVEPEAVWGWVDGHVRDYAPFVPWG